MDYTQNRKKGFMIASKIFITLGVITMYALQFGVVFPMRFLLRGESGTQIDPFFVVVTILLAIVFGLIGLILAIVAGVRNEAPATGYSMVLKFVMIPFFIINFLLWAFILLGTLNPFLIVASPFVIVIGGFLTYLVVLMTSLPDVVFTLIVLNKSYKGCSRKQFIWGIILSFFFVTDVIGAILLHVAFKKARA